MEKQSLKVVVAGRTYPLTVTQQEVEKVQAAAEEINKSIKALQKNYAVKDMQDLLAMTSLQLAVKESKKEVIKVDESAQNALAKVGEELKKLNEELQNL